MPTLDKVERYGEVMVFQYTDGRKCFIGSTISGQAHFMSGALYDYRVPNLHYAFDGGYRVSIEPVESITNKGILMPRVIHLDNSYVELTIMTFFNQNSLTLDLWIYPQPPLYDIFYKSRKEQRNYTMGFKCFRKTLEFFKEIK